MVQNKEIDKQTLTNGGSSEEKTPIVVTPKINGTLNEEEEEEFSEDEDDYLQYLLTVPSLDKNVSCRNMNLITESLSNFYSAIEGRKEYQKIKEELMNELVVPRKTESEETEKIVDVHEELPIVSDIIDESSDELKSELVFDEETDEIEVTDVDSLTIKKFSISFTRARFGKHKMYLF